MNEILKKGTIIVTSGYYLYFEITEFVENLKYPINGNNNFYLATNLETESATILFPNEIKVTWNVLDEAQYLKIKDNLTEEYNRKLSQLEEAHSKIK